MNLQDGYHVRGHKLKKYMQAFSIFWWFLKVPCWYKFAPANCQICSLDISHSMLVSPILILLTVHVSLVHVVVAAASVSQWCLEEGVARRRVGRWVCNVGSWQVTRCHKSCTIFQVFRKSGAYVEHHTQTFIWEEIYFTGWVFFNS